MRHPYARRGSLGALNPCRRGPAAQAGRAAAVYSTFEAAHRACMDNAQHPNRGVGRRRADLVRRGAAYLSGNTSRSAPQSYLIEPVHSPAHLPREDTPREADSGLPSVQPAARFVVVGADRNLNNPK